MWARRSAAVAAPAAVPGRERWVALVILLDYVAAVLTFAAAAAYVILKVVNDSHSLLYPVIDETARWFFYLEIHEMPGLPDYPSLRNFADPDFAFAYMVAMAGVHLLAAAGFLALARGLGRFRPWARRAHLVIAVLAILILGGYAYVYAHSIAPTIGLAVMAAAALVPAAILVILLVPGTASLFGDGPRPDPTAPTHLATRRTRLPRLLIGGFLAAYVVGVLLIVFVVSVSLAIDLKMILAPPG